MIVNTNRPSKGFTYEQGKFFWLVTLLLLILLTALPTMAQDQQIDLKGVAPATINDNMLTQIDAYVTDTMARFDMPGVTIAIIQNGKVIHTNAFGVREMGKDNPVTPETLFMIGSVPKAMTSMMIGTLVDEGVLDWDTPVSEILPSFKLANPEASRSVTFRDLLSMRSGLPNFDLSLFIRTYSAEQVFESLATEIPLLAKPGEQYGYSNQGYSAAGYIAAIAAGAKYGENLYETYAKLMQDRVFDPIGMTHTTLDFDTGARSANLASPHRPNLLTGSFETFSVEWERGGFSIIPAGGTTWSTADDLAQYLITQMNHGLNADGKRLISEKNLLETWKPGIHTANNTDYALGWVIKPGYHNLQQIEYGGGNLGYTSFVSFLPEANLGVVVLTNRFGGDSFTGAVTEYVYETAFGLEHQADAGYTAYEEGLHGAIAEMSSGLEGHIDPETVAAYVGSYGPNMEVHFNDKGDLVATSVFGDMQFFAVSGQKGTFALGLTFGVFAQFADDGSSLTIGAGESQPLVTLDRID
jgi:CubicO group peptidase (beta-lactamase class C family)